MDAWLLLSKKILPLAYYIIIVDIPLIYFEYQLFKDLAIRFDSGYPRINLDQSIVAGLFILEEKNMLKINSVLLNA